MYESAVPAIVTFVGGLVAIVIVYYNYRARK